MANEKHLLRLFLLLIKDNVFGTYSKAHIAPNPC